MSENLRDTIRNLSEIYDKESDDSYVSVYLGKNLDTKFLDRRIKAIKKILKGNELKNFEKTTDKIKEIISKNNDDNKAIFASDKNNFQKYIPLNVEIDKLLVVDSSPYLRPLARILDEWESYTLLVLNSNSAKIFSISMGTVDSTKKISKDIMNKHKKGGWSQGRFNRLRRGAIKSFFKDVIELLEKRADDRIVIAGPGTSKNKFIEMLPQALEEKIVDVVDISIEDENELIKKSLQIVSEKEQEQSKKAAEHLKSEILKDGLAVYGPKETLVAVKNGQVELLIIEKDHKIRGWICEHCQYVEEGVKTKCSYCGNKTSEVDLIEEILEFGERTDVEIEFTDDEIIRELGHVGGILRYK